MSAPDRTQSRTESVDLESLAGARLGEALPLGTLIDGRYELREVFGRGGYAVVYRAYDRQLREEIALKMLRPERLGPTPRARLRREAAVAREAESPRLLRIFDLVLGDALCYLTMEVVHGGSLSDRLGGGSLSVAETVKVGEQVLEGLAALHGLGIVHRDVKPGNILLTAAGDVKLADFGLALRWASDETRATVGDAVVGTVDYLAPEQILGRDADERSDLYSLGVVLFEMLTGELPHRAGSSLGALIGHVRGTPAELRALRPDVPPFLAEVVAGLLEKEPRRRYPSAQAVLADLRAGRRWRSHRVRGRATRIAVGMLALVAVALAGARVLASREPRFSHLVRVGDNGTSAIARDGTVLWTLPMVDPEAGAVVARLHEGEPPRVLTIDRPPGSVEGRLTRMLSILDADTGKVLRKVQLATGAGNFPTFADQYFPVLRAVDLDGDGLDEIVASYFHNPYWPSFTVLYEPKIERSRVVFVASGHHRFAAAEDIDGDGKPELLFFGINNRMGWYSAVAAVKISPDVNVISEALDAPSIDQKIPGTPDANASPPNTHGLLWYSLGPRAALAGAKALRVDREARRITLHFADDTEARFDWKGFLEGSRSPLPEETRAERRSAAYQHLQECTRLTLANDFPAQALAECRMANGLAAEADDRYLTEWTSRALGKALVAQGATAEAEKVFANLLVTSPGLSDAAFDAATSFHLRGQLDRAIDWYRRGFGPGAIDGVGRGKYEFVEGLVLALGELGRWDQAQAEIARFSRLYPMNLQFSEFYAQYVRWRQGTPPAIAGLGDPASSPDLERYWNLEFRWARHESAATLLVALDAELGRASETVALLRALRAELLADLGRRAEAASEAREALQQLRGALTTNVGVAAHYELVANRCARLLRNAGAEADGVLSDLRAWHRARLAANHA